MRNALWLSLFVACGGSGDAAPGRDGGNAPIDAATSTPDAPDPRRVRFIALGDAGKGNPSQYAVAAAMKQVCEARGCDFVILLGDNIYDAGVDSVDDPQWQTKFELPYANLDLPFYVALGNHDYGGRLIVELPGLGNEWKLAQLEVAYTQMSTKWTLPSTFYTFRIGHVGFIVLDSNAILWSDTTYGDQAAWLPTALAEVADAEWVFMAGHHPYRSNGTHGNAGAYDAPELAGVNVPNPLPIQNGADLQDFYDEHLCGIADVYFAGHDHSRQWLDEPTALCGTELVVSGAGASHTELVDRGNQPHYEDASEAGFFYVDVDGDTFTGAFYDENGAMDFTRSFTRTP